MAECLLTKLKASVQSGDLYKINELRMFVPAGNVLRLNVGSEYIPGKTFSITPIVGSFSSGGVTYSTNTPLEIDGVNNYAVTIPNDADAVISISDKQAIKDLYFSSGDRISSVSGKHRTLLNPDFGYMQNLSVIEGYMNYDCETLGRFPVLVSLGKGVYYQGFSPNVWRNYVNHENFPMLIRMVCRSTEPTDQVNIKVLSSLITAESIVCQADQGFVGRVEDLAEGMIANGRTSGILMLGTTSLVTYQGTAPDTQVIYQITFSGSSYSVVVNP